MIARRARIAVLFFAALLALGGCNRVAASWPRPVGPNVLLVTIDTLRADHVGAYGATRGQTPALDALAAEGVVFETAIACAPITLPSHASILTGMVPPKHAVRHNGMFRLDERVTTLAERFQAAGYDTGAVVGAVVLASRFGLAQGFDFYDAQSSGRHSSRTGFAERTAEEVSNLAIGWLGKRERPFFLWAHYYDPHALHRPPAPYLQRFADSPYDGEIAYVDDQLSRLFDALRRTGHWENTIVMVTADHGESLGDHGEIGHAYTLYDAALAVPLILRGPGLPAGLRVGGVVSTLDVAPTLLAAVGLDPLPEADGRDIAPRSEPDATRVADAPDRAVYAETLATRIDHGWAPLFALRSRRHLYVRAPRPELYDVVEDPQQLVNLLDVDADAVRNEIAPLEEQLDRVLSAEREGQRLELDAGTREQLRSLGYALPENAVEGRGTDPKDGLPLLVRFIIAEGEYAYDRLGQAEAKATALLGEMPDSPRLHHLLGRILLERGDSRRALAHAETAVGLVPESGRYRELLGAVRLALGDVAGAVEGYAAALERDPSLVDARVGLMWRLGLGGSLEDSVAQAEAAVAVDPGDLRVRLLVAGTWDRLARYDRAMDAYREILERDPSRAEAHAGLAIQLVRMGDLGEAEAHLAEAGLSGLAPEWRLRLGIAYAGRGELERAQNVLEELIERHPEYEAPRRVLARIRERAPYADRP